ncbi:TIGR02594 family protein [Microbaculum sp. FT89]|uniref:TIGR02594 family protein n=1 Tax=Microbaculum sp. FT89 TaxID=3447298 RepID=UPI003F53E076
MTGISLGRLGLHVTALATASVVASFAVAPASARILDGDPSAVTLTFSPKDTKTAGFTTGVGRTQAISVARRYLGGNPTGQRSQWCADFMNLVEKKIGREGTGSRSSKSYLAYGKPVSNPQPGDIVVLARRGGGHVGYFMGWKDGKIELISGNHGRKVGIGTYPKSRVLGYRRP